MEILSWVGVGRRACRYLVFGEEAQSGQLVLAVVFSLGQTQSLSQPGLQL